MPFSNLPWLSGGPQLFLDAINDGTQSAITKQNNLANQEIARQRNALEEEGQQLQAQQASAKNDTERASIAAQLSINQGRLAQANAALSQRANIAESRLNEQTQRNQDLNNYYNGRLGLGQQAADSRVQKESDQNDYNNRRLDQLSDRLNLKANSQKPTGPMISVAGSMVHADDPRLQTLLNTPRDVITTNAPSVLNPFNLFDATKHPTTYRTNSVLPNPSDITTNQLIQAFSGNTPANNRYKIIQSDNSENQTTQGSDIISSPMWGQNQTPSPVAYFK